MKDEASDFGDASTQNATKDKTNRSWSDQVDQEQQAADFNANNANDSNFNSRGNPNERGGRRGGGGRGRGRSNFSREGKYL